MTGRVGPPSPDIFVTQIGFETGNLTPITSLPQLTRSPELLDRLTRGGLVNFRQSDLSAWQLAANSARLSFDRSTTSTVDIVIYATDTYWDSDGHELDAAWFLQTTGLESTPLIGVGLAGCANFAIAMRTASAYLSAGDAATALIATADICPPEQRILGGGIGVLSDGAATCVATTCRPKHGLQLLGLTMAVEAGLHALLPESEPIAMAMATARGVRRAVSELYEKTGLSPEDFAYLVTNNYIEPTLKIFASSAGLPFSRTYLGAVADYSHCFAADALINLTAMAEEGIPEPGDLILLIVSGYNSWSCMAFSVI